MPEYAFCSTPFRPLCGKWGVSVTIQLLHMCACMAHVLSRVTKTLILSVDDLLDFCLSELTRRPQARHFHTTLPLNMCMYV